MTNKRSDKRTLASHLGKTLREARKKAELTQADVADRVGLVTEVLGRIERGHMLPSVPTLRRLCGVLRVDANAMLALDISKAPSWMEAPEPEAEDHPELRRLVRALRRMDAAQLAVMISTAHALLRHTGQRTDNQVE